MDSEQMLHYNNATTYNVVINRDFFNKTRQIWLGLLAVFLDRCAEFLV